MTDYKFENRCGFCRHYNGVKSRIFSESAIVDCELGISKTLTTPCSSFNPMGRNCYKCVYGESRGNAPYFCHKGHNTISRSPCYDSVLKDYWVENNDVEEKKGCFLSTVACIHQGLADDCFELQILRDFRDNELLKDEKTSKLVFEYYQQSPPIAEKLLKDKEFSQFIFNYFILDIVQMIIKKENKFKIIKQYKKMFHFVQEKISSLD